MSSRALHPHVRLSLLSIATVLLLVVAFLLPADRAQAATTQFVVNPNFSQGTGGWKTNAPTLHPLSRTSAGHNGAGAAIKVNSSSRTVVLNDARSTLTGVAKGTTLTLKAWVRSTRAGVVSQIKAREIASGSRYIHNVKAKLTGTGWTQLSVTFTTKYDNSKLDLNVLFWNTAKGQSLFADDITLTGSSTGGVTIEKPVAPAPVDPPAAQTRPADGACTRPTPKGTQFGSSISTTGQTHAQAVAGVDKIFGTLPIIRVFDGGMPFPWSQRRTEVLAGRDLVMSFRPMPQEVLSGKHDSAFRAWFKEAPSNSTIYWSYIHEPEKLIDQGQFTADQYRRAWQRINNIADSVCRSNMYPTLILTGWTTLPASKRDWRTYYPGGDVIEVMAFDPYNGANNPELRTSYAPIPGLFDPVVRVAKEAGKPWAIAETGSAKINSDGSGAGRAAWLRDIKDYTHRNAGLFVTYFHSTNMGEFRLLDAESQKAWRAAVSSSTSG